MSLIQIRNVPEDVHRKLKVRAATQGLTLSELALGELERSLAKPSIEEIRARLEALPEVPYRGETAAESVRAERDAH